MLMTRVIDWPEGSRLSGMAGAPEGLHPRLWGIISLHLVDLPDGQQGGAEMSMARAHLPFAGTAIHGTYPDGSEWMVLTQVAIVDEEHGFATPEEAAAVLEDQFQRYLRLNPEAFVASEVVLSRLELLTGYQQSGVDFVDLADWAIDELLAGMICEMCNVDLTDVVAGREAGCTFPAIDHHCTGNGFTDVFAQWSQGLLNASHGAPTERDELGGDPQDGGDDEYDDPAKVDAESIQLVAGWLADDAELTWDQLPVSASWPFGGPVRPWDSDEAWSMVAGINRDEFMLDLRSKVAGFDDPDPLPWQ